MGRIRVLLPLSLVTLLVVSAPAGGATSQGSFAAVHETADLSIGVPQGWRVVHGRRTPCTNPVERITLSGHGALVHIQESLPPLRNLQGMPRRPHRFIVEGEPGWIACCPPADGKGWVLPFRDRNRAFYAYLYPGRDGSGAGLLALDSLAVSVRV